MQLTNPIINTGTIAATGVVATTTAPYANYWTIIIDGVAGAATATAQITTATSPGVAAQPISSYNGTALNSIAVTTTTTFVFTLSGPFLTVNVNISAFTSGTIRATILAN